MIRWVIGTLATVVCSGCATLFSGTDQEVTFTSDPPGAQVLLDGVPMGNTPLTVELDRSTFRRSYVTLRAQGYESEKFNVKKTLNTTALFNCTSICFWGTDAITGAMMEYSPGQYFVELSPKGERADRDHRLALQYVLVNHQRVKESLVRRSGEYFHTLAAVFGVRPEDHGAWSDLIGAHAPRLVRFQHPSELFNALRTLLEPYGWRPSAPEYPRFDSTTEIIPSLALGAPRAVHPGAGLYAAWQGPSLTERSWFSSTGPRHHRTRPVASLRPERGP
jgi:hypothetical protein